MSGFSQNGWDVIGITGLDNDEVNGVRLSPGIRPGAVATVLHYVAQQFNNRVEALVVGWCWGYANRTIAGSSDTSNHASGTAIDLNAPRHPMGKVGTFSGDQANIIHAILAECGGVVRWGGDYTDRKDEMHFEINASSAQVTALAAKLTGQPAPQPPAPLPPVPPPTGQKVFLPSAQDTWNFYDLSVAPINGRQKGQLRPSKYPPGLTYAILGWHDGGTTVEIQSPTFGRGKIYVKGTVAVISASGQTLPPPPSQPTETVKNGTWNVRSAASTSAGVIGIATGGQRYATTKIAGGWRQITFNGKTGFVGPLAWS